MLMVGDSALVPFFKLLLSVSSGALMGLRYSQAHARRFALDRVGPGTRTARPWSWAALRGSVRAEAMMAL